MKPCYTIPCHDPQCETHHAEECMQPIGLTTCGYPRTHKIHNDKSSMSYHAFVEAAPLPAEGVNFVSDQIHKGPTCTLCGAVMVYKCLSCGSTPECVPESRGLSEAESNRGVDCAMDDNRASQQSDKPGPTFARSKFSSIYAKDAAKWLREKWPHRPMTTGGLPDESLIKHFQPARKDIERWLVEYAEQAEPIQLAAPECVSAPTPANRHAITIVVLKNHPIKPTRDPNVSVDLDSFMDLRDAYIDALCKLEWAAPAVESSPPRVHLCLFDDYHQIWKCWCGFVTGSSFRVTDHDGKPCATAESRLKLGAVESAPSIKDLAKQMGNAGYCNYAACEEFLQKAFELGRAVESAPSAEAKWISVEDRLPEFNGAYIVAVDGEDYRGAIPADWSANDKQWHNLRGWGPNEVTHWIPLPESPALRRASTKDGK